MFTQFNPNNSLQIKAGYSMIGFTVFNILVNTTIMAVKTVGKVKSKIKMIKAKTLFLL